MLRQCSQCSLDRPSMSESTMKCVGFHAKSTRPLCYGKRSSMESYTPIAASIIMLLTYCSPSAIIRRITTIIINSVNAVFVRWPFAHVGDKGFNRVPSATNLNPTPTVVFIVFIIRIIAAAFHIFQRCVFRTLTQTVDSFKFFTQAATGFCVTACKRPHYNNMFSSTFANTEPFNFVFFGAIYGSDSGKSTERLSGNIFSSAMTCYYLISHLVTSINNVIRGGLFQAGRTRIIAQESTI